MVEHKHFWKFITGSAVFAQLILWGRHLTEPFFDGRFYTNWSNGFWLARMDMMHTVGLLAARFGIVNATVFHDGAYIPTGWYVNHPQLTGLLLYIWTSLVGTREWTVRTLSIAFSLGSTFLLWRVLVSKEKSVVPIYPYIAAALFIASPIMTLYGDKLDQEQIVLFFALLGILGYQLCERTNRWAVATAMIAGAGLVCSDWSGWIIAVLFIFAALLLGRKRTDGKKFLYSFGVGVACGLALSALQLHAQTGSIVRAYSEYQHLYKYRGGSISFQYWLTKQVTYFNFNFASVIGVVGLVVTIGLAVIFYKKQKKVGGSLQIPPEVFIALIAAANLLYALIVRQASAQMTYYQFFYGPAVACGLAFLLVRYIKKSAHIAVATLVLAALFMCIGVVKEFRNSKLYVGTSADIATLSHVHAVDPWERVAAVQLSNFGDWFDNPNVMYYVGRSVALVPAEQAIEAEWVFFVNKNIEENARVLSAALQGSRFTVVSCGTIVCLLHKEKL